MTKNIINENCSKKHQILILLVLCLSLTSAAFANFNNNKSTNAWEIYQKSKNTCWIPFYSSWEKIGPLVKDLSALNSIKKRNSSFPYVVTNGPGDFLSSKTIDSGFFPYSNLASAWNKQEFATLTSQNNILTVAIVTIENTNQAILERILERLEKAGVYKPGVYNVKQYQEVLIKNIQHAEAIEDGLELLIKKFSPHYIALHFERLLENPQYAREIAAGIVILHEGISSNNNNRDLLVANGEHAESLARAIVVLSRADLLREENISALVENPQNAEEIAQGLVESIKKEGGKEKVPLDEQQNSNASENFIRSHRYNNYEISFLLNHYLRSHVGDGLMDNFTLIPTNGRILEENLNTTKRNLANLERSTGHNTRTIVLPIVINTGAYNEHQVALYIYHSEPTSSDPNPAPIITYIDPEADPIPAYLLKILQNQYPHLDASDIRTLDIKFQKDNCSCAPWTIEILRHLVATNGREVSSESFDIHSARHEHSNILEQNNPRIVQASRNYFTMVQRFEQDMRARAQEQLIHSRFYNSDEVNALLNHYLRDDLGEGLIDIVNIPQRNRATPEKNSEIPTETLAELKSLINSRAPGIILPINFNSNSHNDNYFAALCIAHGESTPSNPNPTPVIFYFDPNRNPMPNQILELLQDQYPPEITQGILYLRTISYLYNNTGPYLIEFLRHLFSTGNISSTPEQSFADPNLERGVRWNILELPMNDTAVREEHWSILEQHAPNITEALKAAM